MTRIVLLGSGVRIPTCRNGNDMEDKALNSYLLGSKTFLPNWVHDLARIIRLTAFQTTTAITRWVMYGGQHGRSK
jgi:hypothetical protein